MVSYSLWLMVPNQYHSEDHHSSSSREAVEKHMKLSFLNVSTNEVCTIQLPMDAFCLKGKTICGFSLGWLILSDKQNSSLTLLNPFSGNLFNLPRLPRKGTVHKAILSADPSRNPYDFKLLTIFGDERELIGYEQEHEQWTMLQDYGPHYDDVAVETDEEFIAVNEMGKLVSCDSLVCSEHVPPSFFHGNKIYLLTINGDVFMLVSFSGTSYFFQHETYDDQLKRFEVYQYDEGEWRGTTNLWEITIFLGHNQTLAARNFMDFRSNCIYFIDDDLGKVENSGVFSLKDGKAERIQWFIGRS